ncbi:hypothetical protein LJC07_04010 [Christensenellaceae bacterium OttesenSCG-928-L17]|nr:hypothetical protein [Christensenellaceae bacterium OttesenSCG-928-L17]
MSAEIYDGFVYSLCPTSSTSQQRVYICDIPSKTNTIVMYNGWAAVRYNQTNITVYDGVVYFFGRASSSGTAWSCWKYDIATQTQSCTLINGAAWSTVPVLISGALGIYVRVMGNIYLYDPRNETLTLLGTTTLAVADGAMGMYDPYNFYVMTTGAGGKFIVRTENFPIGDIVVGAKPGSAGTGVLLYDDENTALTCDVAYVVKQTSNGLAAVGAAVNINGGGWTDL